MRKIQQLILSVMLCGLVLTLGCDDAVKKPPAKGNGATSFGDPGDVSEDGHDHSKHAKSDSEHGSDDDEDHKDAKEDVDPPPEVSKTGPWPKAVPNKTLHDFGTMGVDQEMTYVFKIENKGEVPLVLSRGETTCKCTIGQLGNRTIAPGETGDVILTWHPRTEMANFRQIAKIQTNDPDNLLLEFEVKGNVERHLVLLPSRQWYVGQLFMGEEGVVEGSIDSKTIKDFKILEIKSEDPSIEVSHKPYSPKDHEEHSTVGGHWVTVVVKPGLPSGKFNKKVTIVTNAEIPKDKTFQQLVEENKINDNSTDEKTSEDEKPASNGEESSNDEATNEKPGMVLSFRVEGIQDGPYEFMPGPGLRRSPGLTVVNMGAFSASEGKRKEMTVLVRGLGDGELKHLGTDQKLDIFNVTMEPVIDFSEKKDRKKYRVILEIPPGKPSGIYSGSAAKTVILKTDHPNELNREIKLKVEYRSKEG